MADLRLVGTFYIITFHFLFFLNQAFYFFSVSGDRIRWYRQVDRALPPPDITLAASPPLQRVHRGRLQCGDLATKAALFQRGPAIVSTSLRAAQDGEQGTWNRRRHETEIARESQAGRSNPGMWTSRCSDLRIGSMRLSRKIIIPNLSACVALSRGWPNPLNSLHFGCTNCSHKFEI